MLRDRAADLAAAHQELAPQVTTALLAEVAELVPAAWFGERSGPAYVEHLLARVRVLPEVIRR